MGKPTKSQEDILANLAGEAYVDSERALFGRSDVFEQAMDLQLSVRTEIWTDVQQAREDLRAVADTLNDMVERQGLSGQAVRLSGSGVRTPSLQIDPETHITLIKPCDDTDRLESPVDGATGSFTGFYYETVTEAGSQTEGAVLDEAAAVTRGQLLYRVKIGTMDSELVSGDVYAVGVVGADRVEFLHDTALFRAREYLETLLLCEDEEAVALIDELNVLLHSVETPEPNHLREIGVLCERIAARPGFYVDTSAQAAIAQKRRDALAGLVEESTRLSMEMRTVTVAQYVTNHEGRLRVQYEPSGARFKAARGPIVFMAKQVVDVEKQTVTTMHDLVTPYVALAARDGEVYFLGLVDMIDDPEALPGGH